jgi:hypothetical protein
VTLEGTVLEDGKWWIIDPDHCNPGNFYKVLKDHARKYDLRKIYCHGKELQLYRVFIKKDVPVLCISLIQSDHIRVGFSDQISATFRNATIFAQKWTIQDETFVPAKVIFDDILQPRNDDQSCDEGVNCITLSLSTPGGRYGSAGYKHEGQSDFSHVQLIEDGDTVDMF